MIYSIVIKYIFLIYLVREVGGRGEIEGKRKRKRKIEIFFFLIKRVIFNLLRKDDN